MLCGCPSIWPEKANLPEVRWKVANELGPCPYPAFIEVSIDGTLVIAYMGRKFHRNPIEQRWRDESALNPARVFPHPVLQYCQHHSLSWFRWNVSTR
jgi:hypothetical protein